MNIYVQPELARWGRLRGSGGWRGNPGDCVVDIRNKSKIVIEHIQKLNIYSRPETPITARWYRSPRHLEKRVLGLLGNLREHG